MGIYAAAVRSTASLPLCMKEGPRKYRGPSSFGFWETAVPA